MTRILIVEDEESYREPLVYQLTREGYEVSAAATGEGEDIPAPLEGKFYRALTVPHYAAAFESKAAYRSSC